jgi:hypothetical protein
MTEAATTLTRIKRQVGRFANHGAPDLGMYLQRQRQGCADVLAVVKSLACTKPDIRPPVELAGDCPVSDKATPFLNRFERLARCLIGSTTASVAQAPRAAA